MKSHPILTPGTPQNQALAAQAARRLARRLPQPPAAADPAPMADMFAEMEALQADIEAEIDSFYADRAAGRKHIAQLPLFAE